MASINSRKFFYFSTIFLTLFNENFSFAVPQTLRHMRGMSDKPGKSKARRKNMAPKGPTKAEIKYKVGGNVIESVNILEIQISGICLCPHPRT